MVANMYPQAHCMLALLALLPRATNNDRETLVWQNVKNKLSCTQTRGIRATEQMRSVKKAPTLNRLLMGNLRSMVRLSPSRYLQKTVVNTTQKQRQSPPQRSRAAPDQKRQNIRSNSPQKQKSKIKSQLFHSLLAHVATTLCCSTSTTQEDRTP